MPSLIPSVFLFVDFRSYFLEIFRSSFWSDFLVVLFEGITHEYLETLFLVILDPQTLGNDLNLKFFG